MTFIKTIAPEDADGKLAKLYARVKGPDGKVDNILMAHSLRPLTLEGHMVLYKNVLHHSANTLPKWLLETIGVYVSLLNGCDYCVDHHFEGLKRLLKDDARAAAIRLMLEGEEPTPHAALSQKQFAALAYVKNLTRTPGSITAGDIESLRAADYNDGEILEINQVAAYFAYANRTVLGLGCDTKGDTIGLSPNNSDNEDDWGHQ